jgi:hypothetical protein
LTEGGLLFGAPQATDYASLCPETSCAPPDFTRVSLPIGLTDPASVPTIKSVFEKSSLEFRLQAAGREKPRKRGTPNATGRVRSDVPNTL